MISIKLVLEMLSLKKLLFSNSISEEEEHSFLLLDVKLSLNNNFFRSLPDLICLFSLDLYDKSYLVIKIRFGGKLLLSFLISFEIFFFFNKS